MADCRAESRIATPPDGLPGEIFLDEAGRIRAVNYAAERMIGCAAGQVEGRTIRDAVENQGLCALVQYALISVDPIVGRVRCRDGLELDVRVAVRPVPDDGRGGGAGLLCVLETLRRNW